MTSSSHFSLHASRLLRFVAVLFLGSVCSHAQDYQKRLNDTNKIYNDGNVEAACLAYKALYQEKHEAAVDDLQKRACPDMELAHKTAEKLYLEGMDFRRQGKCVEAKSKFTEARSGGQTSVTTDKPIPLTNYPRSSEIEKYLNEPCLPVQPHDGAGPKQDPANDPKVQGNLGDLVKQARVAWTAKNCKSAHQFIEAAFGIQAVNPSAEPLRKSIQACVDEETLRLGLRAYFSLQYDEANSRFREYIDKHGPQQHLALFFRAAVQCSRYLLSAERSQRDWDEARRDFQALPASFRPPPNVVSPKILDLYAKARNEMSK